MNNGGPAFPNTQVHPQTDPEDERYVSDPGWKGREGMTLRDYFAAKAMNAAVQVVIIAAMSNANLPEASNEDLAKKSYEVADAMLKAREAQA